MEFFYGDILVFSCCFFNATVILTICILFVHTCRNAFGPSSGTVCLSGLLICVVRVVRAMVDSARQEGASGMVNLVLQCCVNSLLAAFDFLNKFTINFAAITGEAYCTSARMAYELLKRNLLSAVLVETISTRLLAGIAFVFSAIYAVVVGSTFLPSFCLQVTVLTVSYIASLLVGQPWVDLENRRQYMIHRYVFGS